MKTLVAITVALAALVLPSASGAGPAGACIVVHDPAGDPTHGWAPAGLVPADDATVDLTRLAVAADATDLHLAVGLADPAAEPPAGTERIEVSVQWRAGATFVTATAVRDLSGWRYRWSDSYGRTDAARGSVDRNAGTVTITVPRAIARAFDGTTLDRIRVASRAVMVGAAAGATDEAPNHASILPRYAVGSPCPDGSAAGDVCAVLTAAPRQSDVAAPPVATGSTTLRSVSLAAAPGAMIATLSVVDLADRPPGKGERWEIRWQNPRLFEDTGAQAAFATRTGTSVEYGYHRGTAIASATGTFDEATDTITIEVPRRTMRLLDGTRLTHIEADGMVTSGGVWTSTSHLPTDAERADWVVADACDAVEIQACPVVLDRRGDARTAAGTDDLPENHEGLDLRAVGADPAGDVVSLQAKVTDLRGADPPGADVVGWTVSWLDGDRRLYAQAERAADGLVFRYGARAADGEAPSGPVFGGTATTGELDLAGDIVRIDVPRSVMPADGTTLVGFGATAWALSGRNTANVYLVWDDTTSRSYLTGAACAV